MCYLTVATYINKSVTEQTLLAIHLAATLIIYLMTEKSTTLVFGHFNVADI